MAIVAYTDGSSLGNPGPGGYGLILLETEKMVKKEISQGFRLTTNNRMELMAVCVALETLKFTKTEITIFTDSKYVVDAVEKRWVFGWVKKGFKGKKNEDLWRRFLEVHKIHNVKFQWVKGHAGNVWNERADQLAVGAANNPANFKIDSYFEMNQNEE
ncbi:ribonuclease HI [Algoriella xinjiangensis]|uniref:ribonuclease H n=1 Tax=Algoriella xinjiangensis TaxID=684065 RepID=A0A1I4ZC69_9FLAO|nr:ribonuclease HI [Algoriella xinjiangensis]SFN47855.1 ribonuclease HI [Algoriella xinjiangensis]